MDFVLRIYFIGLIAFLPEEDGEAMTVLVLDARDGYAASDGSVIEPHIPMLVMRAGECSGDCQEQASTVANTIFGRGEQGDSDDNLRRLQSALSGGGAWMLDGADLSLDFGPGDGASVEPGLQIHHGWRQPPNRPQSGESSLLPNGLEDGKDFSWVAEMARIDPTVGAVDPDVVAERPRKGLIAARMRLTRGRIETHRLVTLEDRVVPLMFKPLRGEAEPIDYSQALADWVVAEVPIEGCSVRLEAKSFSGETSRVLELAPESCDGTNSVEMVLVNLPKSTFGSPPPEPPESLVGKHFEIYYELAHLRPPNRLRPVPSPMPMAALAESGSPETRAAGLRLESASPILRAMGLPLGRASRPICPVVGFTGVATDPK